MSSKISLFKMLTYVFGAVIVLGGLFALALYSTIKTKTKDLHNVPPFSDLLEKTVKLNTTTYLMQEFPSRDKAFPYVLMDSTHRHYQWYKDRMALDPPEVKLISTVPAGAKITFEKAANYTNGVSGNSIAWLFGKLKYHGKTYYVGYSWGDMSLSRRFDGNPDNWKFDLAPWQDEKDTSYYHVPEAQWW
ncbi:hypothetical protein H8S90_15495 [Olivibacter sp. SDN3]|uniref:hypothetical protein n=1 Tax=Olivibacter sp. SDN3 TaxID=2764720 RepID=UPI0016511E3A|nr:hypothetical protein [Olivibacter sp. SDN3]QNL48201.1 hypothetical protein H8S90_15495 [Olivibacter sp. SDN3]